ncbi:hypothetical protein L1077_20315 [Pseudoalteromonas luteoviolacea]|uniref:hypothetical protein n=1 Tax=Pseudoalteromonas luteoviolacea TaxID=43657 RepID=UPI001F2AA569|nr:hypothetical protein [Pseudoalteromonas luteoviolacea]MCF6441785.1 hypothetical protein [Pseudoalteromonas luteoviolacea]
MIKPILFALTAAVVSAMPMESQAFSSGFKVTCFKDNKILWSFDFLHGEESYASRAAYHCETRHGGKAHWSY